MSVLVFTVQVGYLSRLLQHHNKLDLFEFCNGNTFVDVFHLVLWRAFMCSPLVLLAFAYLIDMKRNNEYIPTFLYN